jgi:hypothetical protein
LLRASRRAINSAFSLVSFPFNSATFAASILGAADVALSGWSGVMRNSAAPVP